MAYVDVTLTPAATYTYVHNGQIYDRIATTLAAHGNWEYMSYVDAISGADTYRRHVWKCKAAGSGLPSDFFVMFQTKFVTASGVYSQTVPIYIMLAEGYSDGVLSKFATSEASVTPASDLTNPATWTLSTFSQPSSAFWGIRIVAIGPDATTTSIRLIYIVAKDGLFSNWGPSSTSSSSSQGVANPVYAGVYDTLLGVADPMPIIIFSYTGTASMASGSSTRAPLRTPGVAITESFNTTHLWYPANGNGAIGVANPRAGTILGSLGNPAITTWLNSDGGVPALRCHLASYTTSNTTNSAKGMIRGYSKYVRCVASVATHSLGDTFLIDGKVYVGLGSNGLGLWDTTAS